VALEYFSCPRLSTTLAGLLDPVASGDADVEQALGDVHRDLLGPQDPHRLDAGIVDARLVVDRGRPLDREVGRLEQIERCSPRASLSGVPVGA
jgi:hypothetical protein